MTRRWRSLRYGPAVALIVAGIACAALIGGTTGGTLATAFVGLGMLGVVSLIFYEVGLSEDRERARADRGEQARADRASTRSPAEVPSGPPRSGLRRRRPDRLRGQRRRLP